MDSLTAKDTDTAEQRDIWGTYNEYLKRKRDYKRELRKRKREGGSTRKEIPSYPPTNKISQTKKRLLLESPKCIQEMVVESSDEKIDSESGSHEMEPYSEVSDTKYAIEIPINCWEVSHECDLTQRRDRIFTKLEALPFDKRLHFLSTIERFLDKLW